MSIDSPRPPLLLQRLRPTAILPDYQTEQSAGMDLHACLEQEVSVLPGGRVLIPTGWALALSEGYEGQVRPRSGLALRHGITVLNSPGTIDADYRGELSVLLIHLGTTPFVVTHGLRMAQLVIAPVVRAPMLEVQALPPTRRGSGGFGHTGG